MVELLNALFGAATLALFFHVLRQGLRLPRGRSAIACGLVGTSFGFWYYSVCIEVYVIPTFFLVLAFCLLMMGRPTVVRVIGAGVAWALAVLFHQTNVLFTPVVLVAYLSRREPAMGRRWLWCVLCGATASVLVVGVYAGVIAFVMRPQSWPEAWGWLTDYAHRSQWGRFSWAMIPNAVVGFGRCLIGGHFGLSGPMTDGFFGGVLQGHMLEDERFLVRNLSAMGAIILIGTTLLASFFAAIGMLRSVRSRPDECVQPVHTRYRRAALVWFCVYAIFFAWWEPTNSEFWIAPLVAFTLVVWSWIGTGRRGWGCWAIAAGLMFVTNLMGSIRFLTSQDNDLFRQRVGWYAENVAAGELIVAGPRWIWGDYLEYFTPADVWCISERGCDVEAAERLAAAIERRRTAGHRVWVTDDAAQVSVNALGCTGGNAAPITALWERLAPEAESLGPDAGGAFVLPAE